jgi:phosphoglycerol transferase MdoB-like AlkP superfamily enzyme
MKKSFVFSNIYLAMIARLGIVALLYSVSRILFFILNKGYFHFADAGQLLATFFYGIRFDLSAIMFINLLFVALQTIPLNIRYNKIYRKISEIIFYVTNAAGMALNCIDMVFFRFIFRRTTWDVMKGSLIGDDLKTVGAKYLIDYWYAVLIWIGLILIMIFLYRRTIAEANQRIKGAKAYFINILWFLFSIAFSVILFRGGLQLRPVSLVNAGEYATAENIPVLVNTPFSIFSTYNMSAINEKKYLSQEAEKKIFDPVIVNKNSDHKTFRKLNVVIIIVESLSEEYSGRLNKEKSFPEYKGYTPFIDSLLDSSLCFRYSYANSKRSIEGIPAVASGLPSLMNDAFLTSVFSANKINSLPILLKKYGYTSSFFHGGKNGTMNFDAYSKDAGFDHYYGKNEYNNDKDYDGEWGIFDEPFLQYAAATMNSTRQPFVSVIFTISSHHPYRIPDKYRNKFPKGTLEIHESIGYTDYSLKQFFSTFSKMTSFDSTLFVITADHTSIAGSEYYQNPVGAYAVPIIYYMHHSQLKGESKQITQQADIMPSVLGFMNYPDPYTAFGKSVFDTCTPHFAVSLVNNTYLLIKDGYVMQFSNDKATALFDLNNDLYLKNNLISKYPAKATELETFLKAYIQTFNERMIKNKLTAIHD